MDPDNSKILQSFIQAAHKAASDIEYKYHEFWTDPAKKSAMAKAEKSAQE
jgi:hypothetical protein